MQSVVNQTLKERSIREVYKRKVERLSPFQKKQKSEKINQLFKKLPFVDSFYSITGNLSGKKWIAIYKALNNEPDLSPLEQSFFKKWLCYPVVEGDSLKFYSNSKNQWVKNRFQIEEPLDGSPVPIENIFVFCIPGLCFDRNGGRLGKGFGYYDKTLSFFKKESSFLKRSPWFVGLAFTEQIHNDSLPLKNHDVCMDLLLTDSFILAPLNKKKKGY